MIKKITIVLILLFLAIELFITISPGEMRWVDPNIKPTPATSAQKGKLEIKDTTIGAGEAAKKGDIVVVQYTGKLTNGKVFDSSYEKNQPFETKIGVGQVIKGWDEGIPGMRIGGKRVLTIPPDLGYGTQGAPPAIPPNSTLIFEVELVDIK